jgi:hypothetical protein
MQESNPADKREYFRVQTRLRVGMRVVKKEEITSLAADIIHREPSPPSSIDPGLAEWIGRIERKLDAALKRLGAEADVGLLPGSEDVVVLSGGGLLVPVGGKAVPRGTTLLIELTLPELPMRRIRALCTATRDHTEDDDGLALVFSCINESDRDAIIRHCLAVQRSELRRAAAQGRSA